MKKIFRLLLMALPIVLGLVSCAEKDNPVDPNPLAKQVSGLWWSLADQEGTFSDATDSYPYTRMGQAIRFNEDGTGYGITFFFDDDNSDPIAIIGGEGMAPFTYTSKADGRLSLDFSDAYYEYADYFKQWTMTYADGTVSATDGKLTLTLEKPSEQMAVMIHDWDEQFNGGLTPTSFNANTDFTASIWRTEEWIYIYDGVGSDHPTKSGFTIIPLPWNTEHNEGSLQTNLPEGFCNDITPENGWELALNLCGSNLASVKNRNFFALYNKYLGILRFFYYMPGEFTSGNDHVWQVSMSDDLAQHSLYGYGVPSDRTITNKAAIEQTGDTYMEYVTPWVDYKSSDGLIVPNAGWWAFDVDMSTYRANANHDTNSTIKLQMRSWDNHKTSLYSALTANIDGTIKADLKLDQVAKKKSASSTAKGVMMGLQAAAQAGSTIANFYTGNWAGGLTSLGQMLGTGASLAGLGDGGGSTSYTGSLDGTISLGMNGNMNTDGVISGSKATTGVPSPTIALNDFDLKNSHLGQGVWGLKTAPVVYWSSKNIAWHGYNDGWNYHWCKYLPYFFDPSSIEIELNPDVFPDSEIEWVEVNAICGARAGMQPANEALYAAYGGGGLLSKKLSRYTIQGEISDYGQKDCLWDFLYANNDKYGMQELYTVYTKENSDQINLPGPVYKWQEKTQGRGANGYAIEPQVLGGSGESLIPFLEVNVTVRVKMKGMDYPVVLSRNYLPEIKEWNYGVEFDASIKKTRPYASKMKGHTDLYDYQMKRISDIIERYSLPTTSSVYPGYNYIPLDGTGGTDSEGYDKLFDGNKETKWRTNAKKDGKWFVEFMSREPINVYSYGIITANDTEAFPGRNPKNWKVYGKLNKGDQWTEIDHRTNGNPTVGNYMQAWFACGHMKCQYFRFEVSEVVSGDRIQLAEFMFNAK